MNFAANVFTGKNCFHFNGQFQSCFLLQEQTQDMAWREVVQLSVLALYQALNLPETRICVFGFHPDRVGLMTDFPFIYVTVQ